MGTPAILGLETRKNVPGSLCPEKEGKTNHLCPGQHAVMVLGRTLQQWLLILPSKADA